MFGMDLLAGLSVLKTSADLLKLTRDAAKAGTLKQDEFVGRITEVYDHIIDSREAMLKAQEEIQSLRAQLREANDDKEFRNSLQFDPAGIYKRPGPQGEEWYCSACLDDNGKRIRLTRSSFGEGSCHVHGYRG